jgi:hypothetical protein
MFDIKVAAVTLMLQGVLDYCAREGMLSSDRSSLPQYVEILCTAPSDDVALPLGPVIAASIAQPQCKTQPDSPFCSVLFRSLPAANFRIRITGQGQKARIAWELHFAAPA